MSAARLGLVAAACALVACACGADHGVVTSKAHQDAYTYTIMQTIPTDGKGGSILIPQIEYQPECWSVTFHDQQANEDGSSCVPVEQWNGIKVGDYFSDEADS